MTQTETIVDSSVLEEVVLWIRTLKEAGVSADTAASITCKFFLAGSEQQEAEEEDFYEE
jgi:hypothetical protein